jgi:zinc and cadmium transporter
MAPVDAVLLWILASGLLMSAIALVGGVTLVLSERTLQRLLLPLVAFAAGSLIGGAFFHMLPVGLASDMSDVAVYGLLLAGFAAFFGLEQFLHWHHCRRADTDCKKPLTYLILIGDGLHNFLGGLAVAGTFVIDVRLGVITWLAAAAHEVPQELGDFAVLVHGGWERRRALLYNLLSALAFLVGGLVAYAASFRLDVTFLVPFAAGNFIYIGAADLIPEVKAHADPRSNVVHFAAFALGVALMLAVKLALEPRGAD